MKDQISDLLIDRSALLVADGPALLLVDCVALLLGDSVALGVVDSVALLLIDSGALLRRAAEGRGHQRHNPWLELGNHGGCDARDRVRGSRSGGAASRSQRGDDV